MYLHQLIIISVVIIQIGATNNSDLDKYCELECRTPFGPQKHTVCERLEDKCGPHRRCRNFKVLPMTDEFRQALVDKHNLLRNKVALGHEKRGPQPKASNMNVLNWNVELEFIAQCWANTCQMLNHDKCRRTEYLIVGQNMALRGQSWSTGLEDVELSKSFVQSWYDEVADFNPANIRYFAGNPGIGHYTEMVWADIEYVGCGAALYTDGGWYRVLLVCNYGGTKTGGNLLGSRVYQTGEPCSRCPADRSCNKKYKGLCGIDYRISTTSNNTNNSHRGTTSGHKVSYGTTSRYTTKYSTTSRPTVKYITTPKYNVKSSTANIDRTSPISQSVFDDTTINTNNHIRSDTKATNDKSRGDNLCTDIAFLLILTTWLFMNKYLIVTS